MVSALERNFANCWIEGVQRSSNSVGKRWPHDCAADSRGRLDSHRYRLCHGVIAAEVEGELQGFSGDGRPDEFSQEDFGEGRAYHKDPSEQQVLGWPGYALWWHQAETSSWWFGGWWEVDRVQRGDQQVSQWCWNIAVLGRWQAWHPVPHQGTGIQTFKSDQRSNVNFDALHQGRPSGYGWAESSKELSSTCQRIGINPGVWGEPEWMVAWSCNGFRLEWKQSFKSINELWMCLLWRELGVLL